MTDLYVYKNLKETGLFIEVEGEIDSFTFTSDTKQWEFRNFIEEKAISIYTDEKYDNKVGSPIYVMNVNDITKVVRTDFGFKINECINKIIQSNIEIVYIKIV